MDRDMPYVDKDKKSARDKAYYAANKERIDARNRAYRANHLDDERRRQLAWRTENRARSNAIKAKYKAAHPEKVAAQAKKERDTLTEGYVRKKIAQVYSIPSAQIPDSLVGAHRELLKLKREIWKCKTVTN
jgi:hypothetical protein